MKKIILIAVLIVLVLTLNACAAGPNVLTNSVESGREVAGFWQGLWHGFISPFTFLISLFNQNVGIYEVYNNGAWYNFGFLFGASIIFGGGGRSTRRRR